MASLPLGWVDRTNTMSERDIKLGGDAANKFSSSGKAGRANRSSVYTEGDAGYKTSDEVKAFYMEKIAKEEEEQTKAAATVDHKVVASFSAVEGLEAGPALASLPAGWEARQTAKEVYGKQQGAFARNPPKQMQATPTENVSPPSAPPSGPSAEAALLSVATHALNVLGQTLDGNPDAKISGEEKAAFAEAMKHVLGALARC